MEIIMIAAVAKNNVIGKQGKIPWNIREDFRHFKEKTLGHACVMGDVTYDSLPVKPLPGRENIVLTFDKGYNAPGASIFYSFDDAFKYCRDKEKVFIIGGASIYRQGMKYADTLEITRIDREYEGDTFFPEIKEEEWEEVKREDKTSRDTDNDFEVNYSFVTYKKKSKNNKFK